MFNDFISLIFPTTCVNCNRPLIKAEKHLCTSCKIDLPTTDDHKSRKNELFHKFVFSSQIKSAQAFLYFHHAGIAQKLLHQLKYNGKKEIGESLGSWFADSLTGLEVDFIIPIPLHPNRKRKRGYNQSSYIAKGIGNQLGIEVREDIISRARQTTTQTKKSKVQRWQDLENVYSDASEVVRNRKVLVVDDVITTGATIGMLCERLSAQGVQEIHIAAVARGQ